MAFGIEIGVEALLSPTHLLLAFGAGVLGGLLADGLALLLRPSITHVRGLRLFAFGLPAGLYGFYITITLLTAGVWWSLHMWTGAIILSGVVGWLVSYLVVPSSAETVGLRPSE